MEPVALAPSQHPSPWPWGPPTCTHHTYGVLSLGGHNYQLENQRRKKLPSADEGSLRLGAWSSSCRGHVPANCASSPGKAGRACSEGTWPTPLAFLSTPLTVIHVDHLLPVVLALPVLLGGGDEGLVPPPAGHRCLLAALAVLHSPALLHHLRRAPSPEGCHHPRLCSLHQGRCPQVTHRPLLHLQGTLTPSGRVTLVTETLWK